MDVSTVFYIKLDCFLHITENQHYTDPEKNLAIQVHMHKINYTNTTLYHTKFTPIL